VQLAVASSRPDQDRLQGAAPSIAAVVVVDVAADVAASASASAAAAADIAAASAAEGIAAASAAEGIAAAVDTVAVEHEAAARTVLAPDIAPGLGAAWCLYATCNGSVV
jgi:hypothetical protein